MRCYLYKESEDLPWLPHDSLLPVHQIDTRELGVVVKSFKSKNEFLVWNKNGEYFAKDEIRISYSTSNIEKLLHAFYKEHLHLDEEVRFILDGAGYFDIRDKSDRWIRIKLEKGDFIRIPAGIYHRFTLDENFSIHAMRLFSDQPKWVPYERSEDTEELIVRQQYVNSL